MTITQRIIAGVIFIALMSVVAKVAHVVVYALPTWGQATLLAVIFGASAWVLVTGRGR